MSVSVLNTNTQLSGKTILTAEGEWTITGSLNFDRDPNAPFAVTANSAVVTNLDSDKLDGFHGSSYLRTDAATTKTAGALVFEDNIPATFGTGSDATLLYDGTDLVLNTAAVGTGLLSLPKGQLKFPAAQNASSGANVLDDYEEGTFTPTLISTGGGTPTYLTQEGLYVKIGSMITFWSRLAINGFNTLAAGNLTIGGLPQAASATYFGFVHVGLWAALVTAVSMLSGYVQGGTSVIVPTYSAGTGSTGTTQLTKADINTTFDIIFGGSYQASS